MKWLCFIVIAAVGAPLSAQDTDTVTLPMPGRAEAPLVVQSRVVVRERPSRPRSLIPLYVGMAGLSASDAYLTWRGVQQGAIEMNPALRHPSALLSVKAVGGLVTIISSERMWRDHPRRAIAMMIAVTAANGFTVWHNSRVIRQMRR